MTSADDLTPLARAIHDCPDLTAAPDLILRLVDLLFLLAPSAPVPS